jgi:hypothetical protein
MSFRHRHRWGRSCTLRGAGSVLLWPHSQARRQLAQLCHCFLFIGPEKYHFQRNGQVLPALGDSPGSPMGLQEYVYRQGQPCTAQARGRGHWLQHSCPCSLSYAGQDMLTQMPVWVTCCSLLNPLPTRAEALGPSPLPTPCSTPTWALPCLLPLPAFVQC